jgi:hypothetical protein
MERSFASIATGKAQLRAIGKSQEGIDCGVLLGDKAYDADLVAPKLTPARH